MKQRWIITVIAVVAILLFFGGGFTQAQETNEGSQNSGNDTHGGNQSAAGGHGDSGGGHSQWASKFLWIAIILIAAKLSSLVEKWGQPAVLGELVMGVILGNLVLLGVGFFEPLKHDNIIAFLAELGVVILLFQIGLESNIQEMRKVGMKATIVAIIGVILPFALGTWVIGPWILPGLDFNAYLFIGATLTATSVGITARVFKDLGKLSTNEAKIVLGAAVIDDVLGLVILAVVSAIVTIGAVGLGTISWIVAKAVLFLVGAIVIGQILAPAMGRFFASIHTGVGMKFTLAISFALIFAYLADVIGLAPIVGAFAAGLVLDPVHFTYFKDSHIISDIRKYIEKSGVREKTDVMRYLRRHADKHVEDIIEPIGLLLVPIFFIKTGIEVDLSTLFNVPILLVALGITIVAIVGKVAAGAAAGTGNSKWLVGWGMVPRGEVGLIFATIGKGLGVVSDQVFSVIVIMVILTTLITPPILFHMLKKQSAQADMNL